MSDQAKLSVFANENIYLAPIIKNVTVKKKRNHGGKGKKGW